ncbi:ABC1 kinase family protein [Endothiovibrio diazotrophicus]
MIAVDLFRFTTLLAYHALAAVSLGALRPAGGRERAHAVWLRRFLTRMGPVYVKVGQILATRSDLLPAAWIEELKVLQDAVPHMGERETRRAVSRHLGRPLEEVFETFDLTPVASASIAQVHFATLAGGEEVAVKLVKDGVARSIAVNLSLLRFVVRAVEWVSPAARQLLLARRFDELSALLSAQVDMELEGRNQLEVALNFDGHGYVRVPAVHAGISNRNLLVMERVKGIPGVRLAGVRFDRAKLAQRLQDAIYTMLYMHGVCHGDPHPGNLFFSDEGELMLVDFGITVRLSEEEKWGLSSFYYACTRREWKLAIDRFTDHFVEAREEIDRHYGEYARAIGKVLRHHFDESTNQWSTIAYFRDINAVLTRFGARYSHNFTKVELVFLSCEGFARQIDPAIDIFSGEKFSPRPVAGTLGSDPQSVERTLVLQYGHREGLERLREHADELACVVVEPMPASVAKMDVTFLRALREQCDALGVPLVFDEVVSGFRVAYGGAQTLAGVVPDLTCLGKIIGGGLPCGAVAGRREIVDVARSSDDPFFDYENKAFVGGTMSGNSISCAAGSAVLAYLKGAP